MLDTRDGSFDCELQQMRCDLAALKLVNSTLSKTATVLIEWQEVTAKAIFLGRSLIQAMRHICRRRIPYRICVILTVWACLSPATHALPTAFRVHTAYPIN